MQLLSVKRLMLIAMVCGLIYWLSGEYALDAQAQSLPTPVSSLATGESLTHVAWSPDGQRIAIAGSSGIRIYNTDLQQLYYIQDNNKSFNTVDWSPDSLMLATASREDDNVKIWSRNIMTETYSNVATLPLNRPIAIAAKWSADGAKLATLSASDPPKFEGDLVGMIEIWDTANWTVLQELPSFGNITSTIIWSPDSLAVGGSGNCLSSPGWDCPNTFERGIYIFDVETGDFITGFNGITLILRGDADWHPNGRLLIANSELLDIYDTNFIKSASFDPDEGSEIKLVEWHPDGRRLAFSDNSFLFHIADGDTGSVITLLSTPVSGFSWSPNGQYIVSVSQQ
ncbi:MAG: PD40 domain-containing protein, partial [Armatimonadetes bacterium]|nr:PD40 domain-containing protein [Anaerolineae bacterium]